MRFFVYLAKPSGAERTATVANDTPSITMRRVAPALREARQSACFRTTIGVMKALLPERHASTGQLPTGAAAAATRADPGRLRNRHGFLVGGEQGSADTANRDGRALRPAKTPERLAFNIG
ncbi:MAG: hypothetical protein H6942_12480 [Candidatus Accumulibacter sp.]|uniref:hypothetical protein n=1 Tax=Accumulibacter sp. TaxID=2053492 RepID=UPI0019EAB8DF|nr:hypothetical protein [Accumulibacter sp.]MBE2257402.1 hypothetical protein [Paracoccaceae bacterium]MCP5249328.1 hypothetical protein [Accumulibacter sp.]